MSLIFVVVACSSCALIYPINVLVRWTFLCITHIHKTFFDFWGHFLYVWQYFYFCVCNIMFEYLAMELCIHIFMLFFIIFCMFVRCIDVSFWYYMLWIHVVFDIVFSCASHMMTASLCEAECKLV